MDKEITGIEPKKLDWFELQNTVWPLVKDIPKKIIHEAILEIWPLNEGQQYVGSLANHYRGRLKWEGMESLIRQMCSNSLTRLLTWLNNTKQ